MLKYALLSVSDKTNLIEFASFLKSVGYELLSSSGTAKHLEGAGIATTPISVFTGQKEILEGRVKTLHPKIYAGLLARRFFQADLEQLNKEKFELIDLVVVNLYPFVENLETEKNFKSMLELIDIGGPSMLRAAAKNFEQVLPVIDPTDYELVKLIISSKENKYLNERKNLAVKVFAQLANYNLQIAKYLSSLDLETGKALDSEFAEINGAILKKTVSLRYGENPHQNAALYQPLQQQKSNYVQHQGKELSYNNLLDFDAALRIIKTFPVAKPAVVIVKHLNPCGFAVSDTLKNALLAAKSSDPRSHFGGVVAFNSKVDKETAEQVISDFCEVVIAPGFNEEAKQILASKKNIRVLELDFSVAEKFESRSVTSGILVQTSDSKISSVFEAKQVSGEKILDSVYEDLQIAWNLCAHVKSNAITIVKGQKLLAVGAGQMSRIDSLEVALLKCKTHKHDLAQAVVASDAFFPFYDCLEVMHANGIKAIIAPAGSIKDNEVIAKAKELGLALFFTEDRHFRH